MPYSIEEHKHRFAAWAAGRAASTKTCRFNVLQGKHILEATGLHEMICKPDKLPAPADIDRTHCEWRTAGVTAASKEGLVGFSHGIAAKLINVYLKSIFVCAGHESHPNVAALHPPIDSLLLDALHEAPASAQSEAWETARRIRWSKLDSAQYETLIAAIRAASANRPLWEIERLWRGYQ